ncbi:universal stress protein [Spongiivirga citrea]|uniref:Universal stress protein n=1 Tax=Spongiivirga citrea TaxID=1481457 RepID=A0A6M0CLX0_9FLAO|nr:universal stress protein [Spongiivirga citrea]NER16829.1 universal stress protein [Spongiivirga citrea]
MKTILVLTDFSYNAYSALFYAAKLFEDEPSQFIILNSFEDDVVSYSTSISKKEVSNFYQKAKANCLAVQHKLIGDLETTEHTFKIKVTSLSLIKAVKQITNKKSIDLVVMGTRGKTDSNNVFLGSNSFKVIKKIQTIPLLIIPNEIDYVAPRKIGLATGFKNKYDISQIEFLLGLTKRFNTDLKVIYISMDKKFSENQKANFNHLFKIAKHCNPEFNWIPESASKYEALQEYIEKEPLDMLALTYYKHGFINSLFREKVVKDVSRNISIPFIVIPNTA